MLYAKITVKDSVGIEVDDYVNLTIEIKNTNDPPGTPTIVSPLNNEEFLTTDSIDFVGSCDDPDLPHGDTLTYVWTSNITGELGQGTTLSNQKLDEGTHEITLTVSDEEGESASTNIIIKISRPIDDADGKDQTDDANEKDKYIYKAGVWVFVVPIIIIIIIVIVLSAIIFLRRRRIPPRAKHPQQPQQERPQTIPTQGYCESCGLLVNLNYDGSYQCPSCGFMRGK
jgi:hypothetical protein